MRSFPGTTFNAEINVTPLVDVCLVLLIIFMVVTPMMVTGVPVSLPGVTSPEPLARQPLQITLQADGTLFVGAAVMRRDQASAALASERQASDRPVVVQADKSLPYGAVIELLGICREAGFTDVGLAAARK